MPKLRDLHTLPRAPLATPAASKRRWGVPEAVLAAGVAIAVACLAVSSWLARPTVEGIDEATIREVISRAPPSDLYKAWRSFDQTGVDRGATPDESRFARLSRNRAAVAAGLSLIAGAAAVAAVGASLAMALGRRAAGP